MGIALTSAFILCSYAIVSGRGTIPEGALLWAYVVLNIYCTSTSLSTKLTVVCTTNFVAGSANTSPAPPLPETTQPSLPPMIINTYNTLLDLLRQFLPTTIHNTLNFAYTAIIHILTPSILTSLLYRIFVLYAATRVVPAIRGVHQDLADPDFDTSEPVHPIITFILINAY
jgi:ICE2